MQGTLTYCNFKCVLLHVHKQKSPHVDSENFNIVVVVKFASYNFRSYAKIVLSWRQTLLFFELVGSYGCKWFHSVQPSWIFWSFK